jgi:hypothetical protein
LHQVIRKVGYIFVTLDGKVKGDVQGVDTVCCTIFMGDASQPLHVSKFHHGHPGNQREKPVHSTYETRMIDQFAAEIITENADAVSIPFITINQLVKKQRGTFNTTAAVAMILSGSDL